MRAVVQRVRSAAVRVNGDVVGEIDRGLLVYVAVGVGDELKDIKYLVKKVAGLRVFPDERKPMNRSVRDVGGGALVISQFTLYGDCRKGRRPSFNDAEEPSRAKALIERFHGELEGAGVPTTGGVFGATMHVESVNWGPVTILLDSRKAF